MKKLAIGMQSFKKLRDEDCLYVDKTKYIYDLITGGYYYFLARPRRFGKSLLVSTLKEIFLGNKELFQGLWIEKSDYGWKRHAVIHLDLSEFAHETVEALKNSVSLRLKQLAQDYGIDVTEALDPQARFSLLVRSLAKEYGRVVILIDEYDYPMLTHLQTISKALEQQEFLRSFYAVIKSLDDCIRFVFITGVSKFARTSIFSGLNSLEDITNQEQGSALLGYTQQELEHYFREYVSHLSKLTSDSVQDIIEQMKCWYNGYSFSHELIKVYNPYSILRYLKSGIIQNYWFESGTPSFLISFLRKKKVTIEELEKGKVRLDSFGCFDLENLPVLPLLFQAGYLTIKEYDPKERAYRLGVPNYEVRLSLEKDLLSAYAYLESGEIDKKIIGMREALEMKDLPTFCNEVQLLFAHIPYQLHMPTEKYYHSLITLVVSLLGFEVQGEVATDKGRIDLTLETARYLYIFEFKFNQTPLKALEQIEAKKYYEKYLGSAKEIILVGISFNREPEATDIQCVFQELKNTN